MKKKYGPIRVTRQRFMLILAHRFVRHSIVGDWMLRWRIVLCSANLSLDADPGTKHAGTKHAGAEHARSWSTCAEPDTVGEHCGHFRQRGRSRPTGGKRRRATSCGRTIRPSAMCW